MNKKKINRKKTTVVDSELVIQFVGKTQVLDKETGKSKTVLAEAPTQRIQCRRVIDLPSSDEQKKGFTHPDAEFLLAVYPKDFKKVVKKGK